MKILFISLMNGSHWGGSEEMWYRTALWMADHGHEVAVSCYDWPRKDDRLIALRAKKVSVFLLPQKKGFFYGARLRKTVGKIPFEKYDLVFVNQGGYKEVVYPPFDELCHRFKKYILCFHNYDASEKLSAAKTVALRNWMQLSALNVGAARLIFDIIHRNLGINTGRKEVWVNPITFPPPATATAYPSLSDGNYIWTMLAELDTARKSQDQLIECLSSDKWKQRNWQLHLYGRGKDESKLQEMIEKKGMTSKINLKGFTNDVAAVLKNSHLLLQCTRIDAMPISVVEAMALSRPCVVSMVGDMPYWVESGKNGFVSAGISVEDLDKTLEECWQNRENWEEMGKKAFAIFQKAYPIPYEETIANRLESI